MFFLLFKRIPTLFFIFFILFFAFKGKAQFIVSAGNDQAICPGESDVIGGSPTATGGKPPYTYSWAPSTGLSSTGSANPTASPDYNTTYTVTVTDDTGAVKTDEVIVYTSYLFYVNAGKDTSICEHASATLGDSYNPTAAGGGVSFNWSPSISLNSNNSPNPSSTPQQTTTYTLTATISGCPPKTDQVTITVIPFPKIDAGPDITIKEGETATLQGSGAAIYSWSPANKLMYHTTANPNAEPIIQTTYYLWGADSEGKCSANDSMTVFVEPNDDIVIYNTFTPNNDGNNDTWYIGNIFKYPENVLEVFDRNGKLVYKISPYENNWDGKSLGRELPAATYFYLLDLGDGNEKFHGTVTIVK